MVSKGKVKFVHEVSPEPAVYGARKPFRVEQQEQRRFVRLEISSPMTLQRIKDAQGQFTPDGDWHSVNGTILNISAGGVLVETDQPLLSGDVVAMHFIVQDVESLSNVLGMVKRSEQDQQVFLAGIEFITREYLEDVFSQAEMDLLPSSLTNFSEGVREVLNKYVFRERIANRLD